MGLMGPHIEGMFGNHKATIEGPEATLPKHVELRQKFKELAYYLDDVLPDGRQKSIAFTELENASMRSHKAVAETAPLEALMDVRVPTSSKGPDAIPGPPNPPRAPHDRLYG